MKKEPVDFDIMGFASYLQTLDGGNKETEPAKAIAAHVKGYFQYSTPTKPPHMALLDFHKLQNYFTHLKSERNLSATTIADKLRAIRQAIEYVQYEQTDEGCSKTHMKCQEVKDRLKKWGNGLTKDIRRQRNHMSIKSHHEVYMQNLSYNFKIHSIYLHRYKWLTAQRILCNHLKLSIK